MEVNIKEFGRFNDVKYDEIKIENAGKFEISFSNLGARINSWSVPNNDGEMESIILGYESFHHVIESPSSYFGSTIGRVAGRIANSQFQLDGKIYYLAANQGVNHLHGGPDNMAFQKWTHTIDEIENGIQVIFNYLDLDGKNGYPGNLNIEVKHTVTENNEWIIEYTAKTDKKTLFNPTNHVYFNLNGNNKENTENHIIELHADYFLSLGIDNIPTGEVLETEGTSFDLSKGVRYRQLLENDHPQLKQTSGFDHPFILLEL